MSKYHFVSTYKKKVSKQQRSKQMEISLFYDKEEPEFFETFIINQVKGKFYRGDVLNFIEILKKENEKVHLVLTSPPYNTGLSYDNYDDCQKWDDYLNWLCNVFKQIYTIMVPGGRVVLNVPYVLKFNHNKRTLVQKYYEELLENAGFEIKDLIVWIKARSEEEAIQYACRNAAWGSWLSPKKPVLRPIHELLIIAQKQGNFEITGEIDLTKEEFKSWTKSVWFIPPTPHKIHPAVFPEVLVKRVIKLFTTKKQTVFDPFSGVGTTLKIALQLERNALGSEISTTYFLEGTRNIQNLLHNNHKK